MASASVYPIVSEAEMFAKLARNYGKVLKFTVSVHKPEESEDKVEILCTQAREADKAICLEAKKEDKVLFLPLSAKDGAYIGGVISATYQEADRIVQMLTARKEATGGKERGSEHETVERLMRAIRDTKNGL